MTISYEEAIASVLRFVRPERERMVPLANAPGEILAREIVADRNIPPFPRAAMDGFAVRWTGVEQETAWRVVGTLNPGLPWSGSPEPGDCLRIMTGAAVPAPFDTVIPVEQSSVDPSGSVRFASPARRGQNVAAEGEDAREGEVLVPKGTLLFARHVPVLAAVGCHEVPVHERPSVAVLATGGEIVEPWEPAEGPRIRNSNAHYLLAALAGSGFRETRYLGVVEDEREAIVGKVREGLRADFLLVTGGVSAGEIDIVPDCLAACGVRKILHKVSMKPGKPVFVGEADGGKLVFGLPGNPVSVMIHFPMLLRPVLLKASGAGNFLPRPILLPLAREAVNRSGQKKFCPARLETGGEGTRVAEVPFRGSGDFVSASRADGVFEIPLGTSRVPAGDLVRFYPVWGELLQDER